MVKLTSPQLNYFFSYILLEWIKYLYLESWCRDHHDVLTLPCNILFVSMAETSASATIIVDGMNMTCGMDLIKLKWGKFSPALLVAMYAKGVVILMIKEKSSNFPRFMFSFIKLINIYFFFLLSNCFPNIKASQYKHL